MSGSTPFGVYALFAAKGGASTISTETQPIVDMCLRLGSKVRSLRWTARRRRGREPEWVISQDFGGRDGVRPSTFAVVTLPVMEGYGLSWPC